MWSLAWGLVMLRIANSKKIKDRLKPFLIILICLITLPSDWSCIASLCILAFGTNRGNFKKPHTARLIKIKYRKNLYKTANMLYNNVV
jgi:hypothetical protein